MTIGDWLTARTPRPPAALLARLEAVLADDLGRDAAEAPDSLLGAAEQLVEQLLRSGSTSRESALDLLTADALVTYAFEAASERPGDLPGRAERAMHRIAALGAA